MRAPNLCYIMQPNNKYTAVPAQAECDPATFLMTVCDIKNRKCLGVPENRGSTFKTDVMVAQIFSGFHGIPCKDIPHCPTPPRSCLESTSRDILQNSYFSGQPHAYEPESEEDSNQAPPQYALPPGEIPLLIHNIPDQAYGRSYPT